MEHPEIVFFSFQRLFGVSYLIAKFGDAFLVLTMNFTVNGQNLIGSPDSNNMQQVPFLMVLLRSADLSESVIDP